MSESKQMNLMNKDIYKNHILKTDSVIFEYVKILHEYLTHITKNINIKNMIHNKFIINRGYDLLKNIFLTLLLYTKNLELVSFHLRKSYLYYTEFIGQIGEDSNSYLQLNSKDACLFVYKKTIYNINEDYKKHFKDEDEERTKILNNKINIITKIEKYIVEKKLFIENEIKIEKIKDIRISIIKIIEEINKINIENLEKTEIFLDFFLFSNFDIEKKISIFYLFLKKLNKGKIDKKKLISLSLYYENFSEMSALKFINKIFK
jgi:hypothetical protein